MKCSLAGGLFVLFLCFITITVSHDTDADPADITKVHLIFMNHLDVGYNGISPELGFINNVLNKYFHVFFPRAVTVGLQLRMLGYTERMIYTTHPWLVSLFLDCPPHLTLAGVKLLCPNTTEIDNFKEAVKLGVITWHAGPMNMLNEMFDTSMTDFTLTISEDLDKRFGIKRPTRVVSQRDVPGMTISLLPLFEKHGIEAISVGVNGATSPPAVPKIFNWRFHNTSIISMWHPGGYPNTPGSVPIQPGGLSSQDCVTFHGFKEALCFAFRTDNQGPPMSYKEVLQSYDVVRGQFPNAKVQASTFEDFAVAVKPIKDQLPVVTKEIGDTWIQGSASDPMKCALMRAFFRMRTQCLEKAANGNPSACPNDARLHNASRFLTKLGEHTWGISQAGDTINWENKKFYMFLENKTAKYIQGPLTWIEQRQFNYLALDALEDHPLAASVRAEWDKLKTSIPDLTNFTEVSDRSAVITCGKGFKFQFSADGSVIKLDDPDGGIWASAANPIGQYIYQTYNQTDFDEFNKVYPYSSNFFLGIGKPNITKNAKPLSKTWDHVLIVLYKATDGSCKFIAELQPADDQATFYYGAPPRIVISYESGIGPSGLQGFTVNLQWMYKPPTRMAESIFFAFKPVPRSGKYWMMDKLGQMLDPLNVVLNGSQTQHGIDKGVYYMDPNNTSKALAILSLDVPIATMLSSKVPLSAIPMQLSPLDDITGVAYNIYNNVWNTNYIYWYPYVLEDMTNKFRFFLTVGKF